MEFKLINPQSENGFIQNIEFNFDELKNQISENLEKYNNLVYTEDSIKEAKEDRAKLNKFKEAIDNKRKEIKNLCLKPYNEFEAKIKELTGLIDKPILAIDTQVKNFENEQKELKRVDINTFYADVVGDLKELLPLEKIFNPKWLNSTTKFSEIEKELVEIIGKVNGNLAIIRDFKLEPEVELQLIDKYLQTLDFASAMAEKTRLENLKTKLENRNVQAEILTENDTDVQIVQPEPELMKNEQEPAQELTEIKPETVKTYYREFWVEGTKEQLLNLAEYMENNNIRYGGIEQCQSQTA